MKFLWHIQSGIYHAIRCIPGIKLLLNREKENCRSLLPGSIADMPYILDIGTGAGSSLDVIPPGVPVVAADQSLNMLKQAVKRHNRIMPVVADIRALPFKSGCFRFCSCIGVAEYLSPVLPHLLETHRILSESGFFLITGSNQSVLNIIRYALGHRLHLRKADQWTRLFGQARFSCLNRRSSLIQVQWLLKKS